MIQDSKYWKLQLQKDLSRLREFQKLKNGACSDFDLKMGYNWRFSATLKRNHVLYAINQIRELSANEQLSLFD